MHKKASYTQIFTTFWPLLKATGTFKAVGKIWPRIRYKRVYKREFVIIYRFILLLLLLLLFRISFCWKVHFPRPCFRAD